MRTSSSAERCRRGKHSKSSRVSARTETLPRGLRKSIFAGGEACDWEYSHPQFVIFLIERHLLASLAGGHQRYPLLFGAAQGLRAPFEQLLPSSIAFQALGDAKAQRNGDLNTRDLDG